MGFGVILQFLGKKLCITIWQILSLLVLGIVLFLYLRFHNPHRNEVVTLPKIENATTIIGKNGVEYQVIKQTVYLQPDMKKLTDSIKKTLRVNSITQVTTQIQTIHDTIPVSVFVDVNHDITAAEVNKDIEIHFKGNSDTKLGLFTFFLAPDTVTEVSTFKSHLFKSDEHSVFFAHSNSLVKTVAGSSYTYRDRKPIINVELQAGYNIVENKFYYGVGLGIPLFPLLRTK